jgi:hypothetical protein
MPVLLLPGYEDFCAIVKLVVDAYEMDPESSAAPEILFEPKQVVDGDEKFVAKLSEIIADALDAVHISNEPYNKKYTLRLDGVAVTIETPAQLLCRSMLRSAKNVSIKTMNSWYFDADETLKGFNKLFELSENNPFGVENGDLAFGPQRPTQAEWESFAGQMNQIGDVLLSCFRWKGDTDPIDYPNLYAKEKEKIMRKLAEVMAQKS